MKEPLSQLIQQALQHLIKEGLLPADSQPAVQLDHTRDKSHGDLASNIAMILAKPAKKKSARYCTSDYQSPASF